MILTFKIEASGEKYSYNVNENMHFEELYDLIYNVINKNFKITMKHPTTLIEYKTTDINELIRYNKSHAFYIRFELFECNICLEEQPNNNKCDYCNFNYCNVCKRRINKCPQCRRFFI